MYTGEGKRLIGYIREGWGEIKGNIIRYTGEGK